MISVVICRRRRPAQWEIDTWLMSCRVLGRGVEAMVLREILAEARARGIDTLLGVYRPTTRNGMVSDHYKKLGFDAVRTELRRSNLVAARHGHNFGTGVGPDAGASPRQCVRAKRAGRVTVEQERLPRRDWIILPLLSILSLGLLLGLSEVGARIFWPEHLEDRCAVPDPTLGLRFQPNCVAKVKSAETPWLDNSYNACGFRTAESCGPKLDRGFRVAVIGSSISSGYLVPYAETFSARTTALLQQHCHVPVDFQNLALPGTGLEKAVFRVDTALGAATERRADGAVGA